MRTFLFVFLLTTIGVGNIWAQSQAEVYGTITNQNGEPQPAVNISIIGKSQGTVSDSNGFYQLNIPANEEVVIGYSFIGYEIVREVIQLNAGEREKLDITLFPKGVKLEEVQVKGKKKKKIQKISTHKISPEKIEQLPSPSQGVEGIIKTLPGVTSNNELSSQYSVRGGNFDENLIYVNGFEIYRPFLVSSSEQEGLSFINPNLVSDITFSTGGFAPQYGDKMSSVLDIKYKTPSSFGGSINGSLLGGGLHLEGTALQDRFTYLIGARYKTNQYLLNTLDVSGEYKPSFGDIQSYITYDITDNLELGWLGYYSNNKYQLIPEDRQTRLGTVQDVLNFKVFFDGQQVDRFVTAQSGLSLTHDISDQLTLKWLGSIYRTDEEETSDIIGQYWLDAVETSLGEEDFGQKLYSLGVGTFHQWRRNFLTATMISAQHKGTYLWQNHSIKWGLRYQREIINDQVNEWLRRDSAGYSLPFSPQSVLLSEVNKSDIHLTSNRYSGYIQDEWVIDPYYDMQLTGGMRFHYWDVNDQFLVSPRAQFSYAPAWQHDITFRIASGYYYQPPFYRELRDREGHINKDVKAQKSIHFVAGGDWEFSMWNRPFKFMTEIYYKHLRNLNPYTMQNVRIRYFGNNKGEGYATGIDLRLHGEFVDNAESWVSLSLLQTKEHIEGDYDIAQQQDTIHNGICFPNSSFNLFCNKSTYQKGDTIQPDYIPRPTDQRLTFSMFFQDYIPNHKNLKMHLNFIFGTGLPFGPPESIELRNAFRMPSYRRVDLGFSALLYDTKKNALFSPIPGDNYLESVWLTAEIFNLLKVKNTASYFWVKDIDNRLYGIPNYLTSRRVNIKLKAKF